MIMTTPMTPLTFFSPVAGHIRQTAQPPARAGAIAGSLLELAVQAEDDPAFNAGLDPAHMRRAYTILGNDQPADDPLIAARRATCREIAAAIVVSHPHVESTHIGAAKKWWIVAMGWKGDDPRSVAIRKTGTREYSELHAEG